MDSIRSIVVPTDFSPLARAAIARAALLARLDGARIHLVHAVGIPMIVSPYETSLPSAVWEGIHGAAREKLEEERKEAERLSGGTVTAAVADSYDAVAAIADAVAEQRADLVAMGTHGHAGLKRAFLGSVAERTLRSLGGRVLAVKEESEAASQPIRKILVAVDFSDPSERATEIAAHLAKRLGASVDLLHVFDFPGDYNPYLSGLSAEIEQRVTTGATERLDALRNRLEAAGVRVAVELRRGDAPTVIAQTARENGCQLIAMGTRGLRGLDHVLLGSVAERTLRASPCSVLAVGPELAAADGP